MCLCGKIEMCDRCGKFAPHAFKKKCAAPNYMLFAAFADAAGLQKKKMSLVHQRLQSDSLLSLICSFLELHEHGRFASVCALFRRVAKRPTSYSPTVDLSPFACQLTAKIWRSLSHLRPKSLNLTGCDILQVLDPLLAMSSLTSLQLCESQTSRRVRPLEVNELQMLHAPNLRHLSFGYTYCSHDNVRMLISHFPRLESLHMVCGRGVGCREVELLGQLPLLNSLSLSFGAVSSESLRHLGACTALRSLHLLHLYLNFLSAPLQASDFERLVHLTELSIVGPTQGIKLSLDVYFLLALRGLSLVRLQLKRLRLSVQDAHTIFCGPDLVSFSLNDCSDAGGLWMSTLQPHADVVRVDLTRPYPNLTELDLGLSSPPKFFTMNDLVHCTSLLRLSLANCTWEADDKLKAMATIPSLTYLSYTRSTMTGRGLEHLRSLSRLVELDLSSSHLLLDKHLPLLSLLPSLQRLHLHRCRLITHRGLSVLADAPHLRNLGLRSTCKNDAESAHARWLLNMPHLVRLQATDCAIDRDTLRHLRVKGVHVSHSVPYVTAATVAGKNKTGCCLLPQQQQQNKTSTLFSLYWKS